MSHLTFTLGSGILPYSDRIWIDVRSENEFAAGHIPHAVNIPILNNEHRHLVGKCYKEVGHDAAVKLGYDLVGPLFDEIVAKAKEISKGKNIAVYCWRGGMRSSIFSDLLVSNGMNVLRLEGGYKSFRHWCLDKFSRPNRMIILSGKTGCDKTVWLKKLRNAGEPVIDLEDLANHMGSSFGGLGKGEQPSQEHFENLLGVQLSILQTLEERFWIENESRLIGKIRLPDPLFNQFPFMPHLELQLDLEKRIEHIIRDYGQFDKELLIERTRALTKRMGGEQVNLAIQHLEENRMEEWIKLLLHYYDNTYSHSKERSKLMEKIITLEVTESTTERELIEKKFELDGEF